MSDAWTVWTSCCCCLVVYHAELYISWLSTHWMSRALQDVAKYSCLPTKLLRPPPSGKRAQMVMLVCGGTALSSQSSNKLHQTGGILHNQFSRTDRVSYHHLRTLLKFCFRSNNSVLLFDGSPSHIRLECFHEFELLINFPTLINMMVLC